MFDVRFILCLGLILFFAVQNYLAYERGQAFRSVSCVCTDCHPSFSWCQPSIAHFYWESSDVVKRVVSWVDNVSRGAEDNVKKLVKAKFVRGGKMP